MVCVRRHPLEEVTVHESTRTRLCQKLKYSHLPMRVPGLSDIFIRFLVRTFSVVLHCGTVKDKSALAVLGTFHTPA